MNSLIWIIFLSLLFWGFYQKWDEKRKDYIEHPIRTFIYFIFASFAIVVLYPKLATYFTPSFFSFFFFICVIALTLLVYKFIKNIFKGPNPDISKDHAYWKLLDRRYIWPKLAEIIFQQTFFGAVTIIILSHYGINPKTISVIIGSFIFAHIPLFFLQGKKIGTTYLLWSIIGSPIFTLILLTTQSLWYTVSIHLFFYTLLSLFSWMFTGTKYED